MPAASSRNTATAVVAGVGMALLVIMVHQKIMGYDDEGCTTPRWTTTNHTDDRLTLRQRAGRCKLEVDLRGDLRWTDSEDAIAWLEPGGRLDVEERLPDVRHQVKVRASATGEPQLTYWRDGEEMAIDAAGRAWLHRLAMLLYRRTGVDAEARAERIMERGGVDALLDELDEIESDYVAALYARAAFDAADDELAAVLRSVAKRVGSDHTVAELLTDLAAQRVARQPSPELVRALRDALHSLGSDYELRRSVIALLDGAAAEDPELSDMLLQTAAKGLGSDYEAAQTIIAYADVVPAGQPLAPGTFDLLRSIGSDYELRQALVTLARDRRTTDDTRRLLSTSHALGSDYDMAEWLIELAHSGTDGAEIADALHSALATIGSDFERRRAENAWQQPSFQAN